MTALTSSSGALSEPSDVDVIRRSVPTRLAIACVAFITAWMVGGVRATPAFADDGGDRGDHKSSGQHADSAAEDRALVLNSLILLGAVLLAVLLVIGAFF